MMDMLSTSEIEERTMSTEQAVLFRRVVRQAQVIAEAAGAPPARAPGLALELFTSLCWLKPSDQARRVALIDELMHMRTRPATGSRAAQGRQRSRQ
ncbi:MAG: hypothetical protein ACXU71_13805 [Croceibacterium sp.]